MVKISILKCSVCGYIFPYVGGSEVVIHCGTDDLVQDLSRGCEWIGDVEITDERVMALWGVQSPPIHASACEPASRDVGECDSNEASDLGPESGVTEKQEASQ